MDKNLPNVRVGTACMCFNKTGQVLMLLRKGSHGDDTWCMPGGHLEFGETLEQCVAREAKEEADIDVKNLEIISLSNDVAYEKHYITIGMIAHEWTGTPQIMEPEKCTDMRWFSLDNLPNNLFHATKKIIENYKANRIYKKDDK